MNRISRRTLQAFVRRNEGHLFIRVTSQFDGTTDCVQSVGGDQFTPVVVTDQHLERTLGVRGLWLVLGSRDYIDQYYDESFVGFTVSNCCGSCVLVVRRAA